LRPGGGMYLGAGRSAGPDDSLAQRPAKAIAPRIMSIVTQPQPEPFFWRGVWRHAGWADRGGGGGGGATGGASTAGTCVIAVSSSGARTARPQPPQMTAGSPRPVEVCLRPQWVQ